MDKINKELLNTLIEEANKKSDADGEIYFIFSENTAYSHDKRDETIKEIIGNLNEFYISNMDEFLAYPAREVVYDTYTREISKFKRKDKIFTLATKMGFEIMPSVTNTTEQSFILNTGTFEIKLTLKNNLLFSLLIFDSAAASRLEHKGFFTFANIIDGFMRYNNFFKKNTFDIMSMKRDFSLKCLVY